MNKVNSTQQQDGESHEGSYESYRRNSLPEGYTPYRENIQPNEAVYDRYDYAYAGNESEQEPKTCFRNGSSCKIGWLLQLSKIINGLGRCRGFGKSFGDSCE